MSSPPVAAPELAEDDETPARPVAATPEPSRTKTTLPPPAKPPAPAKSAGPAAAAPTSPAKPKTPLPPPKARRGAPKRVRPLDPTRGNVVPPVAGEVLISRPEVDDDDLTLAFPGADRAAVLEPVASTGTGVLEAYTQEAKAAIAHFHRELQGETDANRLGRFHYEIARLYETVLGDLEAAQGHYEHALQATPDPLPVVVGARRVMIARGAYEDALELFDRELRITSDRAAKAALMLAKARVLEDRLGRTTDARKVVGAACELASSDPLALKALEQVDWGLQTWDHLIQTYSREANAVASDPQHRAALIVRRARLLEVHRRDPDAAVEQFEQAYKTDNEAAGALEALKRLHHGRKRWRDVIRVLEIEAAAATHREGRYTARFRIGQLHGERLGNRKEAIASLEQAAQENPDQPVVLDALARLYDQAGAHPALATTLSRLAQSTNDPRERLGYMQRIGELCRDELADGDAAIRAYEAALAIDPTYVPALRALAPMYADREAWEQLVEMHEAEAEATTDIPRRAVAHARAAEILERAGRRVEAIRHHEHAVALDDELASSFRALVRLYGATAEHHKLIDLYDRALPRVDRARQIEYLFSIGDLYRGPLDDAEQAEAAYARILKIDPKHLGAIHAVQRTAEGAGRWKQLVAALEVEVRMQSDRAETVALLHRAGQVLHEQLGQPRDAVARFRRVLEVDAHHRATLASLGRIHHAAGQWADLVEVYRRELEISGDTASNVALLHKMGEVYARFLADRDQAVACFTEALKLEPRHGPSSHALARIYADNEQWRELVALVEAERDHATEPGSKALASLRAGALYEERLDDKPAAERCYAEAVALRSADKAAAEALARVRAQLGRWQALAEDLETRAHGAGDAQGSIALLMRAADVWWHRVQSAERAAGCYEQVLARDPQHLGALIGIEPLFRRLEAWSSLADVLARQVDVVTDAGAKAAALAARARILALYDIGDTDDIVDCYTQLLAFRPGDRSALEGLERLAMQSNDPRILADVDARLAESVTDKDLKAAYLTRQAEALETSGQPQALEVYRSALALDGDNRGALRGLARLAELLGNGRAMVEAFEREAALAREPRQAAESWVRSGIVHVERLDERDGAVRAFERALSLWPDHDNAAARLSELLSRQGEFEVLVERLTRAANDAQDDKRRSVLWIEVSRLHAGELGNLGAALSALQRLLEGQPENAGALFELATLLVGDRRHADALPLLERCIKAAPPLEMRRGAHALAAQCYEVTGEPKQAFRNYERALEMGPDDHDLLGRIVRLQMKEEVWSGAVDTATRLVQIARSDADRVRGLMLLADAKAGAGQGDDAVEVLAEAIVLEGLSGRARTRLARIADSPAAWRKYAEALRQQLERSEGDPSKAAPVFLEIAKVENERLANAELALGTLIEGLRACNSDPALRFELAKRLRELGRYDDAVEQFQYLLMDNVAHPEAWRVLAQTLGNMSLARERDMAIAALSVVDNAAPEREELAGWQPRTAAIGPRSMVPGTLTELFVAREQQEAAAAMLAALGEGFGRVRSLDLARHGVTRRDAVPPRSDHPLRPLIDRIAGIFGVEEFEVYVHRKRDAAIIVEPSPRPSVLLPAWLAELPPSRQVFLLARVMFNLARGVHPIDAFAPHELEVILAAAVRTVAPSYGESVASRDVLDERQKQIMKGLPRRRRKPFEAAATVFARSAPVDLGSFVQWAHQTARRVALVVADDLQASLEALGRTDDLSGGANSPIVADLLKVWVSKPAMDLRRRVGLV